ncbi:DUF1295-domain-containing protein [Macrolepiota fuliginosa MF-IS2]|uniref:DUF1295-domain-containing protein n=1 Tax=Macrolepiota fuliginosa MF-IS2 TaxID=1400762 RepID=A0A9P5XMA5_9AGAR|nr:DUF1295-domain-containing protein [Macrolepiota fuliginosa MF-IS2]
MTFLNVPPAFDWPAQFCTAVTVICFVLSIITSNVSQVDRLWTFLPTIYTAYYALLPLWPNHQPFPLVPYASKSLGHAVLKDYSPRAVLMLTLIIIWMFRLSYNTYRRGLFNLKDEDYRWAILRSQVPAWFFQFTNLTFIAATQNVLLLLLGIPTFITTVLQPHTDLVTSDYVLAAIAVGILAFEFTADNQQYAFQTYKHAFLAREKGDKHFASYVAEKQWPLARLDWTPSDARRGFVTKGLWRYSRHPNFACEQSFWWVITLFPLLASSPPNLPSFPSLSDPSIRNAALLAFFKQCGLLLLPALALSVLFVSSTIFTESITKKKYPAAYSAYQKRVGMFVPFKAIINELSGGRAQEQIDKLVWGEFYGSNESKNSKSD